MWSVCKGKLSKVLQLSQLTKCSYDYEVTVYTARGAKSTLSDGYQVHALVRYSSFTVWFSWDYDLNLASYFQSVFRRYF